MVFASTNTKTSSVVYCVFLLTCFLRKFFEVKYLLGVKANILLPKVCVKNKSVEKYNKQQLSAQSTNKPKKIIGKNH